MKKTIALTTFVALFVSSVYSSPVLIEGDPEILKTLIGQEVSQNEVTDILSEIIGLDIVAFAAQAQVSVIEVLELVNSANEKFQNISDRASPEFKVEITSITLKAIGRFGAIGQRLSNLPQNSSVFTVAMSFASFTRKLNELGTTGVSKEAVVAILDEFLATTFSATVREAIRDYKLVLEIILILDEATLSVNSAVAKEKPEIATELKSLITEVGVNVTKIVRPLIDLVKPAILPDV